MRLDLGGFEAIQAALLEVPSVVDRLGDPASTATELEDWTRRLETLLAAKRMTVAAAVAARRSLLIASRRGRIHEKIQILGKPSRNRIVTATASLVIEEVVSHVHSALDPEEMRFQEAATLASRLVAIAHAKGIVAPEDAVNAIESILGWIESASADPDMAGGFANLSALVGRGDSLTLLRRSLELDR